MRLLLGSLAVAALAAAVACATNPVTGQKELSLVSESQEIAMGQDGAKAARAEIGLYPDTALQRLVAGIGARLAAGSERPQLPWSFQVVDDAVVNAFAFPGGPIFVTRGLLAHVNSEAELAAVIGHEVGHVTARHTASAVTRGQLAQIGLGIGMVLSEQVRQYGGAASSALGVLLLKYGRDAELQADELGFRYALKDGYDVREAARTFETFERMSAGGEDRLPQWLSTHPDPGNRVQRTEARVAALPPGALAGSRVNRDGYLRLVDGLVFGEDPRQGFFQGAVFLHPELRFRLDFPEGWKARNGLSAVTAMSPQQDAQLQLTLAGTTEPSQALRAFLGQQGVSELAGATGTGRVNGLPAASAAFAAQTEQGTLGGMVMFVSHGGNTYQVVGLTAGQLAAARPVFERTFRSFAPVTDARVLGVQPARIDIVRLPRAMSFAEFLRQYPSSVSEAQVALINHAAPEDRFAAGHLLKRVTGGLGAAR